MPFYALHCLAAKGKKVIRGDDVAIGETVLDCTGEILRQGECLFGCLGEALWAFGPEAKVRT